MPDRVTYQFEYDERVRCAFIGAGEHSYRNVYPAFQYAPVELAAVCDVRRERAAAYARMFGGPSGRAAPYTDHREMLAKEKPAAVFIVTSYDQRTGRVQATDLALDCLRAGAHVWMEKPVAASVAEVLRLRRVSAETGRFVMAGLKKIFTPAVEKVASIMASEAFGPVSSISVRYPQALPPMERRHDLKAMRWFLDHVYHPAAVLTHLMGPVERLSYEWEPGGGSSVSTLRFASGAIGSLHLVAGVAATSPLERLEVVGRGANVIVDNGVRLTYYRPGARRDYGRDASFVVDDAVAPLVWEPEFSLGQLSNKNLFYLGYAPEVRHFCDSVLSDRPPVKGTLDDALEIMRLFEAYRETPPGSTVTIARESE
ncbi:Gfo/Idh/MocA family oxidoreductase [Nonomuraea sp. KC401]|uniref:Gfo/Idh/MocA family oxidoreductase n=1 Tax=unclassified Nonomuraea TaxID=2593643 RepID=UPI0010FF3DE1|nr:Gfo/Idh/MocA family oxidoreductase [Nonomuraea sp. KC401]NBE98340.1 Gfo/Idh/MocA family oxidoreductase [Nonomuraea sp. K271]TLF73775.1 Gfo/Idh/MocA family oxidoreductase [Nonomuraea sp. KC401]